MLWQRTEQKLDTIKELAGDAFPRTGSLRITDDDEEAAELREEY